jgi:hypothetical protein
MDEDSETRRNESNAAQYLDQTKDEFFISPSSGLYLPKSSHPTNEINVRLDGHLNSPGQSRERPLGSWQDSIANLISGVALLVSACTLFGLILTARIAYQQWQEMKRATEASTAAANTAACALDENRRQFTNTLRQMQGQTIAQQNAANASSDSAIAMSGQVDAANKANGIAQQSLEAQTRPWLAPVDERAFENIVTNTSTQTKDGATTETLTVQFDLKFRNYGQSAAMFTLPRFELLANHAGKQDAIRRDGDAMCDAAKRDITFMNQDLDVIFPGTDGIVYRRKISAESNSNVPVVPPSKGIAFLVGCIAYQGAGAVPYFTAVFYRVVYSDKTMTSRDGTEYYTIDHFDRWWFEPRESWSPRK